MAKKKSRKKRKKENLNPVICAAVVLYVFLLMCTPAITFALDSLEIQAMVIVDIIITALFIAFMIWYKIRADRKKKSNNLEIRSNRKQ